MEDHNKDDKDERIYVTKCERCGDSPTSIDAQTRQCFGCDDKHGQQLDIFDEKKSSWNDIMKVGADQPTDDWAVTDVDFVGSKINYVTVENSAGQSIYAKDLELDISPNVKSSWETWGEGSGAGSQEVYDVDVNANPQDLYIGSASYASPDSEEIEYQHPNVPEEITKIVLDALLDNDQITSELERSAIDSYNDGYDENYDDYND